jgi:hypothetical protein
MYRDESPLLPIFFVLAVVVFGGIGYSKCSGGDHHSAAKEFNVWAKSLDLKYDHVTCNGHDGDGDGYVSCTYTVDGEINSIECAGSWSMQRGCRTPKAIIRQQQ